MSGLSLRERVHALDAEARARLGQLLAEHMPPADPSPDYQLVAYLTTERGVDPDELRRELGRSLPEWMVPSAFVTLDALPRNPNGKVDRQALPSATNQAGTIADDLPRDATERALLDMWVDLLGTDDLGIHDDFFSHGGDSLLALRLTTAIERHFEVALPVATVFQLTTVAQLASALPRATHPADSVTPALAHSCIVEIQTGGTETPLFCAHCIYGRVHHYFELARHLGPEQPVYGVQPPLSEGTEVLPATLPALAERYVREIRAVQPNGPYRLCGFSFGGVVAFEIAQQLQAAGEAVELLAMFDSIIARETRLERLSRHAHGLAQGSLGGALRHIAGSVAGNMASAMRAAKKLPLRMRRQALAAQHRMQGRPPVSVEHQHTLVFVALSRTMRSYRPRPYPGRVLLFRQTESEWLGKRFPDRGWRKLAAELAMEDITGGHGALLRQPGVVQVARRISAELGSAGNDREVKARDSTT